MHYANMNLRAIRKARGLSQQQLADMVGVTQPTIVRAETMDDGAMLRTYIKCADALGVTLADIFADDRSALEQTLIGAFRRVPVEKHPMLFDLLKLAEAQPAITDAQTPPTGDPKAP